MKYNTSYLVCKEYLQEVSGFLSNFFYEEKDKYTYEDWISFKVPGSDFKVSLMKGADQDITQNMTFEITCDSLEQLKDEANKHGVVVDNFLATETSKPYKYYYAEVLGPGNICKIEMNYIEENF